MRMPKSQPWSPGLKNVKPKKNLHHNRYIADLSNKICSNIPVFSSSDSSTISVSPDSSSMESERLSLEGLAELLFSAVLVRSELGVLRFQRSLIGLQFQKSGHCSDCLNLLTSTARLSLLDFILSGLYITRQLISLPRCARNQTGKVTLTFFAPWYLQIFSYFPVSNVDLNGLKL